MNFPWMPSPGGRSEPQNSDNRNPIYAPTGRRTLLHRVLLGGVPWLALPALAAPVHDATFPDLSVFEHAEVVPDSELDEMRGRFVESGHVKFFGLQFLTLWQTPEGIMTAVGLEWSSDPAFSGISLDQNPVVSIFHSPPGSDLPSFDIDAADINLGSDPDHLLSLGALSFQNFGKPGGEEPVPLNASADLGGLESASGAVQGLSAAGDFNAIGQDLNINVVTDGQSGWSTAPVLPLPVGLPQELDQTETWEFDSGFKTTAFVEPGALGFVIASPEHGKVLQEIRGAPGHAAQFANIDSHANRIRNMMNINIGIDRPALLAGRTNLQSELKFLRVVSQ